MTDQSGGRDSHNRSISYQIRVKGLVQGVGFRPFVYRLAHIFGYMGWVENRSDGVLIIIPAEGVDPEPFISALRTEAPLAAHIESIDFQVSEVLLPGAFEIRGSNQGLDEITEISPDIAVCQQCLEDMKEQPHRIGYPLVNCTLCGPRFSIIRGLPYDRALTTMEPFIMCPECAKEYGDVDNRRFHAQPIACNSCGPKHSLFIHGKESDLLSVDAMIEEIAERIASGENVALKGTGGYHLLCDAHQEDAVLRLREAKERDGKPFAVMFRDIKVAERYVYIDREEQEVITSWRRPVVLMRSRGILPGLINSHLDTIGAILPYMPVHDLLFHQLKTDAVVFTSGNISDEPVEILDKNAINSLGRVASAILLYNREICNRADDSVVRVQCGQTMVIRRSRGFVPRPVRLKLDAEGIFAAGGELKSTFCVGRGNQALLSQHIGDLQNAETYDFYLEAVQHFRKMYSFEPILVAADFHPDYLATRFAESLGLPVERVQHHHAHIAACMAEYGLDEPVIGLSFDGTGMGDDGTIWGSEVMVATLESYERRENAGVISLPGGDSATLEPWRIGMSLLYDVYGTDALPIACNLMPDVPPENFEGVAIALEKGINIVRSSGLGRLFDGVAALTGICLRPTFEAEGPMRLESIAKPGVTDSYMLDGGGCFTIQAVIKAITEDLFSGIPVPFIAAKFHNAVILFATGAVKRAHIETGIKKVVLSGGAFQNRILAEKLTQKLSRENYLTFIPSQVPCNDGGLSLGQLAVAAKRRKL